MAELNARFDIDVYVEFYSFALQEEDDLEVSVPFPDGRDNFSDPPFLTAFEKRLDFASGGHTHGAALPWAADSEQELTSGAVPLPGILFGVRHGVE
ncbi:hypothetical protein [Streptomyces sp. NPDC050504]|uniref:hypothetical protein n=1 Tax=Streptomyces sp. NPDC050504 TaxID=3365618 RepID=UPI00379BEEFA